MHGREGGLQSSSGGQAHVCFLPRACWVRLISGCCFCCETVSCFAEWCYVFDEGSLAQSPRVHPSCDVNGARAEPSPAAALCWADSLGLGAVLIYTSINSSLIQLTGSVCFSHSLCKMEIFPGIWWLWAKVCESGVQLFHTIPTAEVLSITGSAVCTS